MNEYSDGKIPAYCQNKSIHNDESYCENLNPYQSILDVNKCLTLCGRQTRLHVDCETAFKDDKHAFVSRKNLP